MEENFTWSDPWGGHIAIVLTLLTISTRYNEQFAWNLPFGGGSAHLIVSGITLIVFAVPFMSLQVRKSKQPYLFVHEYTY